MDDNLVAPAFRDFSQTERPNSLPPAGSDSNQIAWYVDCLVRDANQDERRQAWLLEAERNLNLYVGNHFVTPEQDYEIRVVMNRIQNVVISMMAVQAGDVPKVTFLPRETGDEPLYYLNTTLPEAQKFAQASAITGTMPEQPLSMPEVQQIQQEIEASKQLTEMSKLAGQPAPPPLPEDLLIEVNDQTAADAIQTVFDIQWEASDGQIIFAENVLNKNILGVQPTLVEFDDELKIHRLTNIHAVQVFFDGIRADPATSSFQIYDEPMGEDEAIERYPHMADAIREMASTGALRWPGSRVYSPAIRYSRSFLRRMVVIRHAWIAHQPFPLSPDEAMSAGLVQMQEIPDVASQPSPVVDDGTDTEGGGQVAQPAPVPQNRTVFMAQDGSETAPGRPNWPQKFGIRYLKILWNQVLDDREYPYDSFPLPTNINIPVPYSPYGQGEPVRLEGLQMALNYVLSSTTTHQRYNAYPVEVRAQAIEDRMPVELRDARIQPGKALTIPDDLLSDPRFGGDLKKLITYMEQIPLSNDVWKWIELLIRLIDQEGNQADVMQGNASATWSGEAINSLQNAASQVIRAKSMHTEIYLKRMAKLMVQSIITRCTPADLHKMCGKYPPHVWEALHAKFKSMQFDISTQIQSGSGASKQAQTNNIIAAKQAGRPISEPTILEHLGLDPDTEAKRQQDWDRSNAPAMQQQQMQQLQAQQQQIQGA